MSNLGKSRYRRTVSVNEKTFQAQLLELLSLYGWRVYHTYDSRKSAAGFPDLIAIRGRTLLAIEVKTDTGKVRAEQYEWLNAFAGVKDVDAMIIRPAADLDEFAAMLGSKA